MGLTGAVLEQLTQTITQNTPFSEPIVWMSLHSDDPGSTGLNEITFGSGVEGRQSVPFAAGTMGTDTNSADVTFTVAVAVTIPYIGFWDSQLGGDFLGGFPLAGPMTLCTGIVGANTLFVPNHSFQIGDAVRLFQPPGYVGAVPSPLALDTPYTVWSTPTSDLLNLIEPGGIVATLTSSGSLAIAADLSVTPPAAGGLVVFQSGTGVSYSTVS